MKSPKTLVQQSILTSSKAEALVREPESTEIFQSRVFAPSSSLKINEVVKYLINYNAFGLERHGKDLVVSFRRKEVRNYFNGKTHTIGKIKIEVGVFPPQPKENESIRNIILP